MNKKYIIFGVIVIAIVILIILLGGMSDKTTDPSPSVSEIIEQQVADSPEQITTDLNSLDEGDINKEFQDIDTQIKSL
ncbi:MAG: hypothetical protein WC099_02525 [Candidatus Paceibacterota bacterium]